MIPSLHLIIVRYGRGFGNSFSDHTRPFGITWNPDKAGFYPIKATAEDASGAKLTTPVKHVTLKAQN